MKLKKWWGLVAIISLHLVISLIWLLVDRTPPAWDGAFHIKEVILFGRWPRLGLVETIRTAYGYPPLVYFVGGVWGRLVGVGIDRIVFLNSIFLGLSLWGMWQLAQILAKEMKLWIVIVFSLLPVVYQTSREMLLDMPLLALVVWGLYFWYKSKDFSRWNYNLAFWGCMVGASLTKLNGFIYFGPMMIISLVRSKNWGNIILLGLMWVGGVFWWWLLNWQNIVSYLTGLAGQGEPLTDPMNLLSISTWLHYFKLFFLHQAGPIAAIVFVLSLRAIRESPVHKKIIRLLWWMGINYVVFTVIKNKDYRFTLPLLAGVAVVLGVGLSKRKFLAWGLAGFLLINMILNSFNWFGGRSVRLGFRSFVAGEWVDIVNFSGDYPVRAAKTASWPQQQIVADLERLGAKRVLVLINKEEVNDNNLSMYREMGGGSFEVGSVGTRVSFANEEEIRIFIEEYDYFLLPRAGFEPAPFYGINLQAYKQAINWLWQNKDRFEQVGEYNTGWEEKLYLWKIF